MQFIRMPWPSTQLYSRAINYKKKWKWGRVVKVEFGAELLRCIVLRLQLNIWTWCMDFDLDFFFFYLFIVSETVIKKCKCNYTIKPSEEKNEKCKTYLALTRDQTAHRHSIYVLKGHVWLTALLCVRFLEYVHACLCAPLCVCVSVISCDKLNFTPWLSVW